MIITVTRLSSTRVLITQQVLHARSVLLVNKEHGGDHGLVFPTVGTDEKVVAVTETKERRHDTFARPWQKHGPAGAK